MLLEYILRAFALMAVLILFACIVITSIHDYTNNLFPAVMSICVVYLIYFLFWRPRLY